MASYDPGKLIELVDKLDGFKRFVLVLPIEFAFVVAVLMLIQVGEVEKSLAAITALLGTMIGYYFGTQAKAA